MEYRTRSLFPEITAYPLPPKLKVETCVATELFVQSLLGVRFNFEFGGKGVSCDFQK